MAVYVKNMHLANFNLSGDVNLHRERCMMKFYSVKQRHGISQLVVKRIDIFLVIGNCDTMSRSDFQFY